MGVTPTTFYLDDILTTKENSPDAALRPGCFFLKNLRPLSPFCQVPDNSFNQEGRNGEMFGDTLIV
jgi:hypothetical protein